MKKIYAMVHWGLAMCGWLLGWRGPEDVIYKIHRVRKIFRELDRDICSFQKKAKLVCPGRCGHCCANSNVETTVLEMLPLADDLIRRGVVDFWWSKAEEKNFSGRCVFFAADPSNDNDGRCGEYALRPLICRLFGYTGNRDKYGHLRLVACGIMKRFSPDVTEDALEAVSAGKLKAPVMADVVMKLSLLEPDAGESLPINMAFKKAVDRMWLYRKFGK